MVDIDYRREQLARLIEAGIVKDPALYWAGRMSSTIRELYDGKATDINKYLCQAIEYADEYDYILVSRTGSGSWETGK